METLLSDELCHYVVCAGSRNIALVIKLISNPKNKIIPHFEEREASFFALGLSKKLCKPVAVVCTSGTAVSECFSAVIEAHYSGVPLVILSADRPARFRKIAAPQTIEQQNIFGAYVGLSLDIDEGDFFNKKTILPLNGPSHVNVKIEEGINNHTFIEQPKTDFSEIKTLESFFDSSKLPLILIGELSAQESKVVETFLLRLGAPVYAEASSGLRESKQLERLLLRGSDRVVTKILEKKLIDGIVRIGGIPTLRAWRDLENYPIPVISLSNRAFSGSPVSSLIHHDISEALNNFSINKQYYFPDGIRAIDSRGEKELARLIYEYPLSEPALLFGLSHQIHPHDSVFLGNSLPIREWDLAASRRTAHPLITTQRGTNGIDGQLSHFFGNLDGNRHNWGIFGDLTTLYGLNAFWILKEFPSVPVTIIVINNSGGDIFRRLPQLKQSFKENPTLESIITNNHQIDFSNVAQLWGLDFERMTTFTKPLRTLGKSLIEVVPDPNQTNKFWDTWNTFWNSLR